MQNKQLAYLPEVKRYTSYFSICLYVYLAFNSLVLEVSAWWF